MFNNLETNLQAHCEASVVVRSAEVEVDFIYRSVQATKILALDIYLRIANAD